MAAKKKKKIKFKVVIKKDCRINTFIPIREVTTISPDILYADEVYNGQALRDYVLALKKHGRQFADVRMTRLKEIVIGEPHRMLPIDGFAQQVNVHTFEKPNKLFMLSFSETGYNLKEYKVYDKKN